MLGVDLTMPPAIVEQSSRSPSPDVANVDAQRPEREQSERPVRCSSSLERSTTSGRCAFASLRSLRVATPVEPATPFHHKGDPASKNDGPDDGQDESSGQFAPDRKSTRLNSSHSQISYAVFCLKKKKKRTTSHPCTGRQETQPSYASMTRRYALTPYAAV